MNLKQIIVKLEENEIIEPISLYQPNAIGSFKPCVTQVKALVFHPNNFDSLKIIKKREKDMLSKIFNMQTMSLNFVVATE